MKLAKILLLATALSVGLGMAQPGGGQQNPNSPRQMQQPQGVRTNLMWETASFLGVTPPEMMMLADGQKTISDIAKQLGGDVAKLEAKLVQVRNQAIDQAVQNKALTAEQATTYKASTAAVVKAFLALKPDPKNMRGFGPGGMGMGPGRGGPGR